jgi:hypothetical protein
MAVTNFIPEIWSAAVAQALQDTAVIAPITNTQYEGEASRGNQVHITGVIPPTVTDYAAATRTTTAEDLSDDGDTLLINQEKSFDFHVDDIDRVQAAGSFESWTTAAGRALGEDADAYIAARAIAEGTNATATLGGATALNADTDGSATWNAIRDFRKILNKASVPAGERFLLMNAEFEANLLANDAKLAKADESGTPAGLRDATLGRVLGFTLVVSNQLPVSDFPQAVAFWRPALAYVSQIDKVDGMRSHTKFADRVRGLHVYGSKVVSMYQTSVQFFTGAAA